MSKMPRRTLFKIFMVVLLILLATFLYNYPKLNIISGYAAKYMASGVNIANRTAQSIQDEDLNVPLVKLASTSSSQTKNSAKAEVYGLMERRAVCREGLGCLLLPGNEKNAPEIKAPVRKIADTTTYFPFGNLGIRDTVLPEVDYHYIEEALDSAFDSLQQPKTRSVLIVYRGEVLGERYAEGIGPHTPILGWSMSKSVLATCFGILQSQGLLNLNDPAPIREWEKDERGNITLNDLLRMQSGLAWDEDYTGISDVTRMLFMEPDMTQVQVRKKALAPPGEIWNYSSGTSNLLSGILRSLFPTHEAYINFPYKAFIDKLGMESMIIETDMAGNYVGSSYTWANTRDWAKFGLLYLNRGNWNGEQLLDPEWIDYVAKPTDHSDGTYGAHFWLNALGKYRDIPTDLFSANGYQGQYVFIIPSLELVVVRTGLAEPDDSQINTFLSDIIRALPVRQPL